ncbi:hypothetical protein Tco_0542621 [Tanacetum coccineum]
MPLISSLPPFMVGGVGGRLVMLVTMDNPNITMEEYIRLKEEKARRRVISANDLKTDLENNNDKVNMPLFSSLKPTVSCINDLDFFKDFETEFLAIVYNDALTSKSDFLTELDVSPQHIDEFDLKDETSLSEWDEEEHNVLYFNDLFPFNVIHPDDSKLDKDNDDDNIDIEHSSWVEDIAACLVEYVKLWDDWEVDRYGNANLVNKEYLVKVNKRRAFWSLKEDILKIYDFDYQYAVSIKKIRLIRA